MLVLTLAVFPRFEALLIPRFWVKDPTPALSSTPRTCCRPLSKVSVKAPVSFRTCNKTVKKLDTERYLRLRMCCRLVAKREDQKTGQQGRLHQYQPVFLEMHQQQQ